MFWLFKMNDVQKLLFQFTRMTKMNIKEQSTKSKKMTIPLKFGLVPYASLHVCSIPNGKMRRSLLQTSHHDNKLPNTENFSNIIWLGKLRFQKSRFQVTKMLKINIMKHSITKYRSDDSFKI